MAIHKWNDIKAKGALSAEQVRNVEQETLAELREADLRALREALDITQEEMARRLKVTQGQLSKLEKRDDDNRLSVIREMVAALGGEIEVTAVFGKKRVKLVAA
jgi:predicted transcriptional regulator